MQPRFLQRAGKRPYRLLEHPRFRAGYDFLLLRCESGELDAALGEWWERFQHAGEAERAADAGGRRRAAQAPAPAPPARACAATSGGRDEGGRRRRSAQGDALTGERRVLTLTTRHAPLVTAFIALGSNLDDPAAQIRSALRALAALPETRLVRQSSLYRNPPVGYLDQPEFVNAVAQIETRLAPRDAARAAARRSSARTAACATSPTRRARSTSTSLLYGERVVHEPGLTIPHPRMHERAFVLVPLAEIAPDAVVPGSGRVADLAAKLDASGLVKLA